MTGDADDIARRGRAVRLRRLALKMDVKDLAEEAHVDRGRLALWEKGEATVRPVTAAAVESALDRIEGEINGPYDTDKDVVTFRLRGNFGVDVTLAGPVTNLPELEASVTRLLKSMGDQSGNQPSSDGG